MAKAPLSVSSASSQLSSSTHSFISPRRASKRRASVSESVIQSSTSGNKRSHPVRASAARAAAAMSRTVRINPAAASSSCRSRPQSRLHPRHRLIRANVLTESNIRDLVKLLDEEMDGVAAEQRQRLETTEEELEDVKRRLGRIWQVIETTDIEMADASERIKEHRDRKEKLEVAAGEARALLSERRQFLDSADTFAAEIKPKGHALLESLDRRFLSYLNQPES